MEYYILFLKKQFYQNKKISSLDLLLKRKNIETKNN